MKYARLERERRFLLAALPPGLDRGAAHRRLDDLYLEGTSLRLRSVTAPSGAILEQKLGQKRSTAGGDPAQRWMTSIYLEPAEHALLAGLPGRRLAKRRYDFPFGGRRFVIDEFLGPLAGLVLAEVELGEDGQLGMPPFARCEVTALPLFTGGSLAREDPGHVLAEARRLLGLVP